MVKDGSSNRAEACASAMFAATVVFAATVAALDVGCSEPSHRNGELVHLRRAALSDRLANLEGDPRLTAWPRKLELAMDRSLLAEVALPTATAVESGGGTAVYVLRVVEGAEGPAYVPHEAGMGAFSMDYWPASVVKVLAAIAAAERLLIDYDFTGAAIVDYGLGGEFDNQSLRAAYNPSISVSSNSGYSRTLQVAGGDWINERFFTAERGFPYTLLQRTYVAGNTYSATALPQLTFSQDGRNEVEPARSVSILSPPAGCSTDGLIGRTQNCMSLYDMVEGLRRLVLDDEVMPFERFILDPSDISELTNTLCTPHSGDYMSSQATAIGGARRVCNKTGFVPGFHCLDHAYIEANDGQRLFIAIASPYAQGCSGVLGPIARATFEALAGTSVAGVPVQHDAGSLRVDWRLVGGQLELEVTAPGADRSEVYVGPARQEGPAVHTFVHPATPGEHLVVVRAFTEGRPTAYRSFLFDGSEVVGCIPLDPGGDRCEERMDAGTVVGVDGGTAMPRTDADVGVGIDEGGPIEPEGPGPNSAPLTSGCACRAAPPAWPSAPPWSLLLLGLVVACLRRRGPRG